MEEKAKDTPPQAVPPVEEKKDEKSRYGRVFSCGAHGVTDMDVAALKAHLETEHGVTSWSGKKQMVSHVDGRDYFSSVYEWTLTAGDGSDVVVIESAWAERAKDDPMRGS
jgi:hypothetical protein